MTALVGEWVPGESGGTQPGGGTTPGMLPSSTALIFKSLLLWPSKHWPFEKVNEKSITVGKVGSRSSWVFETLFQHQVNESYFSWNVRLCSQV